MSYHFILRDRVQFSDTDLAGIVHFSNFFRYMERAEHAFFRSLELSVMDRAEDVAKEERVGWPRVHASCDYRAPLRFEEEFDMEVLIEEIRSKTIRYVIRFWKLDGELAAVGKLVAACVRKDPTTGKMKAVTIPERIHNRISAAPAEALVLPEKRGA